MNPLISRRWRGRTWFWKTDGRGPVTLFPFHDRSDSMTVASGLLRTLSLAVLVAVVVSGTKTRAQHTRTVQRTIDLRPDGKVHLSAAVGSVRVETWDRPAVEMRLQIEGDTPKQVETSRVLVEGDSSQVAIRTDNADPDGPGFLDLIGLSSTEGPATYYALRVPTTASVQVSTQNAAVNVGGLEGDVTVEGSASAVRVRNVDGRVIVGTLSGPVRLENVRGEVICGTYSGDLFLRTSSLPKKSQIGSFSGNAEIVLPADAAFDLRTAITWGGSVTSDFAMPDSSTQDDGLIPIGGGGPMVAFESFSGSLTLRAE